MFLLDKLTALLPPRAQPYAKALYPAAATVAALAAHWVATGELDGAALNTALTGAVATLLAFLIPNAKK